MHRTCLGLAAVVLTAACGPMDFGPASGVSDAPDWDGPPGPPGEDAPTGTKWEGVEVNGACGRISLAWVLVDEVCGGTEDPGYLDAFRSPMFRDGARIGDRVYAVDASHLWVLDAADPTAPKRLGMVGGLGHPLSVGVHAGRLVAAAGSEGLVLMDLSDPIAPKRAATVSLPGPALDVFVEGDRALVAMGAAGVAAVDLGASPPALAGVFAVPGFAAGVATAGGIAYVAACDTLALVHVASGALLSEIWVPEAHDGEILVAPAKDVALADTVAFVAAGRFGAVAVDVSAPSQPKLLGNCTVGDDLSFYASGVRGDASRLFVAGGEWGILPVGTGDPLEACSSWVAPTLPKLPEDGGECSTDPPWKVLPWQDLWAPPPPLKDPIQTLPAGGVLYAFGDARRIGRRAIDVRQSDATLAHLGRYDEPRLVTGLAAATGRLLVVGEAGGLFHRHETALLVPAGALPEAQKAIAGAMLGDGRWALARPDGVLTVEGATAPIETGAEIWSGGLAAQGEKLYLPATDGALVVEAQSVVASLASGRTAELPQAIAASDTGVFLAAPEWTTAVQAGATDGTPLAPHGLFALEDVLDAARWRHGLPRRLLVATSAGLAEVAMLGGEAALALHGATTVTVPLPPATYSGGAASAGRLYLASTDRGRYWSQLVTIALDGPSIVATEAFVGVATAVAVDADRLYVGDADRGVRVYALGGDEPSLLGVVPLGVSP
jgi:hypothetical protein